MSENKCPCCGDTISIFTDSGFYECDNCPFMCGLDDLPRIVAAMEFYEADNRLGGNVTFEDYVTLITRHAALVEAVVWERECRAEDSRQHRRRNWAAVEDAEESWFEARAEVDRLIGGE